MSMQILQFLFSGITLGAAYTLAALGFSMIYNASGVINFAQGEFIMIGGMAAAFLSGLGVALPLACLGGVALAAIIGVLVERLAIAPTRHAEVTSIIIITIGVSMVLRGGTEILLGKHNRALPPFSGERPFEFIGASILPQSLWVLGLSALIVLALALFFSRARFGKAMLATAYNKLAARLVGVDVRKVMMVAFALSAAIGAVGGVALAPITTVAYDTGLMLGLKGFVAAVLGGLGSGVGAIFGGLLLGVLEAGTAGFISSAYKDAVPFLLVFVVLIVRPQGLLGAPLSDRV